MTSSTSMSWSVDSCQTTVSAEKYHNHIVCSGVELIKLTCFSSFKLTTDQILSHMGSQAQVLYFFLSRYILYFPIAHNALCLPPKFCINYCFGNMQSSQENLKTIVDAKCLGQTKCIMGNWKIENVLRGFCWWDFFYWS